MMADQNIKPLYPVPPAGKILKKNKLPDKKVPESATEEKIKEKSNKKGIIDTYA
jgi:hypothetical protein